MATESGSGSSTLRRDPFITFRERYKQMLPNQHAVNHPPRPTPSSSNKTTSSAPNSQSTVKDTKAYLTSLPLELQLKIWTYALLPPRVIHLRAEEGYIALTNSKQYSLKYPHVWAYPIPPPTILQINHLSRPIGLHHYSLIFDSNPQPCREHL